MSAAKLRQHALRLAAAYLAAKRSGNVPRVQRAYDAILSFCRQNELDFDNVLTGAARVLQKRNPIAFKMSGFGE